MISFWMESLSPKGHLSSKDFFQTILICFTMVLGGTLWRRRKAWHRTVLLVNKFPGSKVYGMLGTLADLKHVNFDPTRIFMDWIQKMAEEHGPVFRSWLLTTPHVFVCDPDIAHFLFTKDHLQGKASVIYTTAKAAEGEGLLALPAQVHPQRRKQWMHSFTRKQIENSSVFFRQQAKRLCVELMGHQDTQNAFDFLEMSVGCTFRAICYSAFGKEYMEKLPEGIGKDHMHDVHIVTRNIVERSIRPWQYNDFIYLYLTQKGRETRKCVERGTRLTKDALRERRSIYKLQKSQNQMFGNQQADDDLASMKSNNNLECFLDQMIRLLEDGQLTEKEVIQELNAFIVAGYDTSGITICYFLYLISRHPEHQQKVVDELCQVIPPQNWKNISDYDITSLETKQLKHLELCIKETLRLYPILPVSPRSTTQEVQLPDGRILPAGVDVYVNLSMIHRHPKYFPNPEAFQPERHLQPSPAFMPFTLGSRNCIGQVYAIQEMKTILAYLLMSFRWETTETENFKPIYQGLQVPEKGLYFKIHKRQFDSIIE